MNVSFPPDIQTFIDLQIARGEFRSTEEFAVAAARLYQDLEGRYEALRDRVSQAQAQIDSGASIELDGVEVLEEYFESVKRRARQRT